MSLLDEIAQRAGVSRMTVSNVLNARTKGSTNAARKRVEKIKRIASELNYTPNAAARALSSGQTHNVGLIFADRVPEMRGIMHELLETLSMVLEENGYHLLFVPFFGESSLVLLRSQRFDGCVVMDPTTRGLTDVLTELGTPGVLINVRSDTPTASVMPDDVGGVRLAFEHLYQLGHRRIAYFRTAISSKSMHESVCLRRKTFLDAAQEFGIADQCTVDDCPVEEFVERHRFGVGGMTAVVGYCHDEAFLLLRHLAMKGLRLPQDVSVVAFNDISPTEMMRPALTMVDVRPHELGRIGAHLLIEQMRDDLPPRHVTIQERLVIRESTMAPPGEG